MPIDIVTVCLALINGPEVFEPGIKPGSGYFQDARHQAHRIVCLLKLHQNIGVPVLLLRGIDVAGLPQAHSQPSNRPPGGEEMLCLPQSLRVKSDHYRQLHDVYALWLPICPKLGIAPQYCHCIGCLSGINHDAGSITSILLGESTTFSRMNMFP